MEGGNPSEWHRPADESLPGTLFSSSYGAYRALQFDGVTNAGLFVSDNIDNIVEKLPQKDMTVEAFFTVGKDQVSFAGLVSIQQDGTSCHKVFLAQNHPCVRFTKCANEFCGMSATVD